MPAKTKNKQRSKATERAPEKSSKWWVWAIVIGIIIALLLWLVVPAILAAFGPCNSDDCCRANVQFGVDDDFSVDNNESYYVSEIFPIGISVQAKWVDYIRDNNINSTEDFLAWVDANTTGVQPGWWQLNWADWADIRNIVSWEDGNMSLDGQNATICEPGVYFMLGFQITVCYENGTEFETVDIEFTEFTILGDIVELINNVNETFVLDCGESFSAIINDVSDIPNVTLGSDCTVSVNMNGEDEDFGGWY